VKLNAIVIITIVITLSCDIKSLFIIYLVIYKENLKNQLIHVFNSVMFSEPSDALDQILFLVWGKGNEQYNPCLPGVVVL
jgi:hypothetical protein